VLQPRHTAHSEARPCAGAFHQVGGAQAAPQGRRWSETVDGEGLPESLAGAGGRLITSLNQACPHVRPAWPKCHAALLDLSWEIGL